jgi:hypothetical protein
MLLAMLLGEQPIGGSLLLLLGLLMIAFNERSAKQFEEHQKAMGEWGMQKHAYIFWRIVSIVFGAMLTCLGALLLF